MIYQKRIRTKQKDMAYVSYLYFNGLSLRNTAKAIQRFVYRSHSAIRDWIQKYKPIKRSIFNKSKYCRIYNR
jgi:transposase-like protein